MIEAPAGRAADACGGRALVAAFGRAVVPLSLVAPLRRSETLVPALRLDRTGQMCARMCELGPENRGITRQNGLYPSAYGSEGWEFESLRAHTVLRQ